MDIHTITQLASVNSVEKIQALNALGIFTIPDMAEYAACRHAEFVMACFKQGNAEDAGLENYIEAPARTPDNLAHLDQLDMVYLISLSETDAKLLERAFGIKTMAQLAVFPPYLEARQIVEESIRGTFYENPSAPPALIPKLIGSTHTQVRFSNYVKEKEFVFDDYALLHFPDADEPEPAHELLDIFYRAQLKFHLGYLASIHQKWIDHGKYLGEIKHSLALAPGESRIIAVLDWYRRQLSSRDEDTTVSEQLHSDFIQTRALNEVVRTTANEHLYGSTTVDATTKTTSESIVQGRGGGFSAGTSASVDLTALVGLPLQVAGGLLGSTSSSIGHSQVYSNGSVQGTLASETTGERTVTGELVQNISDATVQNASNVRSVMSTVIVEDTQGGRQRAQTRNVTNYNHSHALTVQYYEVLDSYRVDTGVDSLSPVLFLPFGPITYNIELIKRYWYIFNKAIRQLQPGKAFEWNQVVKDFNPENEAFDISGDLRVERVKITRTRSYSEPVRVKFYDANPEVTLAISGFDMDGCLILKMTGKGDYVKYGVLDLDVFDESSFFTASGGTTESFDIGEGVKVKLSSVFRAELKRMLKIYLDDESLTEKMPIGTKEEDLKDNQIGPGSNRPNLKEDVDNDKFSILNGSATVDLWLDKIEYTVADQNDQEQIVTQTIHKTYTYAELEREISEELADVEAYINAQLAVIVDADPAKVIAEIEDYFNFYKYGFTKYLLANLEKEQIKDAVEHLGISGTTETLALSALIDPAPVGLTENMLIFKLKEDADGLHRAIGQNFFGWLRSPLFGSGAALSGNGLKQAAVRRGRETTKYRFWGQPNMAGKDSNFSTANLTLYVDTKPGKAGKRAVEGSVDLVQTIGNRQFTYPLKLTGTTDQVRDNQVSIDYTVEGALPGGHGSFEPGTLDWTVHFPEPSGEDIAEIIVDYVHELDEHEHVVRQRHHWETVFLPSRGVFAEAILGLSNASEYINVRRFFNWQDSPIPNLAPAIQAVDVNRDYTQPEPESLAPTVPVSVLNQITPQQYPMPTSLTSALQTIGQPIFPDMSKTDQFMSILDSLGQLANNAALQSSSLAGDAAANTLSGALGLGNTVASMVGSAMNSNVADPPQTPTAQGGVLNALDEIGQSSNGGPISPIDQAQMGALGAPLPTTPGGLLAPDTGNTATISILGPTNLVVDPNETVVLTADVQPAGSTVLWSGGGAPASGTGSTFTTRFPASGDYSVTASVSGGTGAGATATVAVHVRELSGGAWVARFPQSTSTADLVEPFRSNVESFIAALTAAGAPPNINTTYRPRERAYLMHYAPKVASGLAPDSVPPEPGVDICWQHRRADGTPDIAASRAAAQEMANGYNVSYPAAFPTRHTAGLAIDMTINWTGDITVNDADGNPVLINTEPRTGGRRYDSQGNEYPPDAPERTGNTQLHAVGATYNVIKRLDDPPHWSDNGR